MIQHYDIKIYSTNKIEIITASVTLKLSKNASKSYDEKSVVLTYLSWTWKLCLTRNQLFR